MPIDEAAAVEAPKEGSPEYLIMVCRQHMAWLTVYAEGMTQEDWRDMQDRLVSQIGKLVTDFAALAALKPFLGGWRNAVIEECASVCDRMDQTAIVGFYDAEDCAVAIRKLAASPDKGGE